MKLPAVENLVFEGGGVKGVAYAGAIKALDERGILKNIKRVSGTSAGALTAMLMAIRYSAKEVHDIINATNYNDFKDGWSPIRLFTRQGLYRGKALLNFIKKLIRDRGFSDSITFQELHDSNCLDLKVFATNLNMEQASEFSYSNTPGVYVAEAVRASMSIPLFFSAWKFTHEEAGPHLYVDGGTVLNYPIFIYDDRDEPNFATMGFHLDNLHGHHVHRDLKYGQIHKFITVLFHTLMRSQVIEFEHDPNEEHRTVKIDDFGISATDFAITGSDRDRLYQSGYDCTIEFLNRRKEKEI